VNEDLSVNQGTKPFVNPFFQRLALLTGAEALERLEKTSVLVFGVGGVGSWCAEALARSGVGNIGIIDSDTVCITNINRQVQATKNTVGLSKVETLKERLLAINPRCTVTAWEKVFSKESEESFGIDKADYCIDAIDSLSNKIELIDYTASCGTKLFSCMGMAQKLDPTRIKTADIWKTEGCPLAALIRKGLRKQGFTGNFTAVYSNEQLPLHREIGVACGSALCLCPERDRSDPGAPVEWCSAKKVINGSSVTVTATAGMILASLVIQDVCSVSTHG
jgi:tRNA A37 threonylcarbamoyladenosine dehydratase